MVKRIISICIVILILLQGYSSNTQIQVLEEQIDNLEKEIAQRVSIKKVDY